MCTRTRNFTEKHARARVVSISGSVSQLRSCPLPLPFPLLSRLRGFTASNNGTMMGEKDEGSVHERGCAKASEKKERESEMRDDESLIAISAAHMCNVLGERTSGEREEGREQVPPP